MDARIKQVEHPGESWLDFRIENVPYSRMVEILGEPLSDGDGGHKVDVEWVVVPKDCISPETEEGQHLIVWNWKNGRNYGGDVANLVSWSAFGNLGLAGKLFGLAHVPPVVPA